MKATATVSFQYCNFLQRFKAGGGRTSKATCPICGKQIEITLPPKEMDVWDSAFRCPMCGGIVFKEVFSTGRARLSVPDRSEK